MPFLTENSASASSSTIAEHLKLRRPPRNQINITETDPNPVPDIPSVVQSARSKSSISSLFLSTFSSTNNETTTTTLHPSTNTKKKANPFSQSTLRGLGCTASASQQVSVPAMIRTSADWEAKKVKKKKKTQQQEQEKKKKKQKKKKSGKLVGNENSSNKVHHQQGVVLNEGSGNNISCGVIQDVWCGPGIGFSADAVGSVDCVVARRNVPARGKIDVEKVNHRERSCIARRTVNPETLSFLDSDSALISAHPEPDFFGARYYRHVRHPSPEGLAEIMMLQNNLLMGGRLDSHDRFSDWRLDIDSMSYEQLLELGDKIGYVNTGLKEDEISRCLRKIKGSIMNELPPNLHTHVDKKCSICQEEYEADEEMGKLYCGHSFHIQCIKQWLVQKNTCPVCKTEAATRC
ncbi:RING/U-box superfamily protein, putative isoform 2 [Theobroma cacao]|uniref:RING-type E3 ubiquitin transferase n=1 Tax=Theobroma cacao TaxID=3641 RepID=A0A061FVM0_THECC|nr:RING/U-box superfamily protein, putative isoform 2 [Theobroma cacao]